MISGAETRAMGVKKETGLPHGDLVCDGLAVAGVGGVALT